MSCTGIIGYVKASSLVSLIAGVGSGALLALIGYLHMAEFEHR